MSFDFSVLNPTERIIFELRSLYTKFGYMPFKMSKFEEYDLYGSNKDFLVSGNCITFTDTDGRLLALKPDVTFSIIKNLDDTVKGVQKVYYNENVYRESKKAGGFSEIMQTGIECMGDITDNDVCDVIILAARSLYAISENYVLDISHLGILSELFDYAGVPEENRDSVMKLIGEKNTHELEKLLSSVGISDDKIAEVKKIVSVYGESKAVISEMRSTMEFAKSSKTLDRFEKIINAVNFAGLGNILRIDFSVTGDVTYYNGIVFRGFISGIPSSVLSGGQYDKLMKKMQKKSGAIGFAVYLDMLERYMGTKKEWDVDTVIIYDEDTSLKLLNNTVESYAEKGSVCVQRCIPEGFIYKTLVKISNGEVNILENDA